MVFWTFSFVFDSTAYSPPALHEPITSPSQGGRNCVSFFAVFENEANHKYKLDAH